MAGRPPALRRGVASVLDLQAVADAGPRTLEDWFSWPLKVSSILKSAEDSGKIPGGLARCIASLKNGWSLTSHYTGQASAEQAAEYVQVALEFQGYNELRKDVGLVTMQACDLKSTCQKVLCSFPESHRPKHIFGDLVQRLPPDVLAI